MASSLVLCASLALAPLGGRAATIVDGWSEVKAPPPPVLQSVTVDPATTALLVFDFVKQLCSGPVCTAALPVEAGLLHTARANHLLVVYSLIFGATPADVMPAVAPLGTEPVVQAGPDKFIGTDLQSILATHGIKTVIVTGMTAQGVVLFTASHAALTGFSVIVPIDAAPAELPYAQQAVVWTLGNAPRISAAVKLTTSDRIAF
jgi:nicotinamidase-related amidase